MIALRIGADVWLTSPRLRGEVGLPRRCEASSGAIRVRGTIRAFSIRGGSPSPQPSKSELRSSRPREERVEGEVVRRFNLNSSRSRKPEAEETLMALLQNHIAVVTGAGSGIGRAIASGYAGEGARVVLLDVNEKAASEAAREIRDGGGKAESFALDVIRREDCIAAARQIADKVGQVSILVNNAGIARRNGMTGAAEAVIKDWEDIIAINLTGVFNVTHAFLGPLRAAKGRIVNIGSIQSFVHVRTPSSARMACASTRSARDSSKRR